MSIEWEIDELACKVCGKTEDEAEQIINDAEVDNMLYEKYEISAEQYYEIVKDLLPYTPIVQTALTSAKYHAFIDEKESRMLARLEVKEGT